MPKWTGKEKNAQAGYIKVLPPLQKTENKGGRKVSTGGGTPTVAKDKLSQSSPNPQPKLTVAKGKKTSEPTPPKGSTEGGTPTTASQSSLRTQPKPVPDKGKKTSEPTPPKGSTERGTPTAASQSSLKPQPQPVPDKGKKTSEPTPPKDSTGGGTPTAASQSPTKSQPKPIAARKMSEPIPPQVSTEGGTPTAAIAKLSQSVPKSQPKPTPAKWKKMSEPTPLKVTMRGAPSQEGTKNIMKRASELQFEAANKQVDSPIARSFLSIDSINHSGTESYRRPHSSSDVPCWASSLPDQLSASDKLQVEQDMKQFIRTGNAVSLWNIANSGTVQLPQLFVAESSYDGPPAIDKGQVIMVVKIKTTAQVHGTHSNGKEITLTSTSSPMLSPLCEGMKVSQSLSAKALLMHKVLPPVVAVAKQFALSAENVVTAGTILFLQREQSSDTNKGNKELQGALVLRDLGGQEFTITAKCTGTFSTHPRDTSLVLQEVVKHCQLPLKVLVYDSKEEMTLESITQQQLLVAYPFNARQKSDCKVFELPAEGNLQLVRVIMQSKEMEMEARLCDDADELGMSHNYETISDWTKRPKQTTPTEKVFSPSATQPHSVIQTISEDLSSTRRTKSPSLGNPPLSGASALGTSDEYNEKKVAENRTYLRSLKADEILELLEAMQLEEYRESFKMERIDGEVLSSLTEADLLRELNIQKRLHRVRLMKVIEGIYSTRDILSQIYV